MAVAFDAKPTAYNSSDGLNQEAVGATSCTATTGMTAGGSATTIVGMLSFSSWVAAAPTNIAMTWDSASLGSGLTISSTSGSQTSTSSIWSKESPSTGAKTLASSWTTAQDVYMSCITFTGSQRYVSGDASNTQSASIAINTTSDGATVANFAIDGNTPTVSQTKIWAEAPNNPGGGGSYAIGGSSTTTHTFTSSAGSWRSLVGVQLTAKTGTLTNSFTRQFARVRASNY